MIKIISCNSHYKRQLESYRLPHLPLIWQCQFLSDVVYHVSLRWSGAEHYQPRSYPAFRNQPAASSDSPLTAVCVHWHHTLHICRESRGSGMSDQPAVARTTTQLCPCKTEKLMMLKHLLLFRIYLWVLQCYLWMFLLKWLLQKCRILQYHKHRLQNTTVLQ